MKSKIIASNLYQRILKIEKYNGVWEPHNFVDKSKINKLLKKNKKLENKLKNIEWLLQRNEKTNIQASQKNNDKIVKIKRKIINNQSRINEIRSLSKSKYHAQLVKKLENCKNKKSGAKKNDNGYAIILKDVVKYYNNGTIATKVLDGINLKIKNGEFVIIFGPSGSGKTTLMNILSGMDTATYGKTIINGESLINKNNDELTKFRRDNIGYIFQQYGLLPNLTVRENVEVGAYLQKNNNKLVNIDEILKSIGMYEHRNKYPHELSGGQQQRVSIARSLAKNPMIIFGDEPTGAIDEEMAKEVLQLFVDINKKNKTTIIIVTHNPIFASLGTLVIRVANGKIIKIDRNKKTKKVSELDWTGNK